MGVRVPAYFDAFLDAIAQGASIDHVHLGYWESAPGRAPAMASGSFEEAQDRLAQKLIDIARIAPGDRVLDAGCGFGGLIRRIDHLISNVSLCGLNIDARQIAICRRIACRPQNRLTWIAGDACHMPFRAGSFERILCLEAIFHFSNRRAFLAEAFRLLAPGGLLILTDILLRRPEPDFVLTPPAAEQALATSLGPWPVPWCSADELRSMARDCGFITESEIDATDNTRPSYNWVAPHVARPFDGPMLLRLLHEQGYLTYFFMAASKPHVSFSNPAEPNQE